MSKKTMATSMIIILASFLTLSLLSINVSSWLGYNADALYAYSQARDLVEDFNLSGWVFSAIPFTFPDVILSIPAYLISGSPINYVALTSPLQIGLFVVLYIYFCRVSCGTPRVYTLASMIISLTILEVINKFVFMKINPSFFFMEEGLFVFARHGFAATLSVIIYLVLAKKQFELRKFDLIVILLIVMLLSISDFYFCFYLGSILICSFRPSNWRKVMPITLGFFVITCVVFLASWRLNHNLRIQATNSLLSGGDSSFNLLVGYFTIWVLPICCYSWLYYKKRTNFVLTSLLASIFFMSLLLSVFGLVKSVSLFRYMAVVMPISILLLNEIVVSFKRNYIIPSLFLSLTICCYIFISTKPINTLKRVYQEEIECVADVGANGTSLVAEYWAAKVIFESTNRIKNLYQVDSNFNIFDWIVNKKWSQIHPDTSSIIVTNGLSKKVLKQIEEKYSPQHLCVSKILLIDLPASVLLREMQLSQ